MKNLKTLIKLKKHSVNEILKRISLLQQHKAVLEARLVRLVSEMDSEIEKYNATEYGFALDAYLVGLRAEKQKLLHGVVTAELKLRETQLSLHSEFGEMKKLEIALQNREKTALAEVELRELKLLDDINIMRKIGA